MFIPPIPLSDWIVILFFHQISKGCEPMTYASEITAILLNVVLTCIIVCGGICAGIEYSLKRSPGYLAVMAIFLSYIIDNSIVFCTEMIPAFAEVYDRLFLETPSLKTLVFIVRISSILFLLSRTMREFTITRVLILSAIHASLLILVPIIKEYNLMVFFYYFPSQFVVICVSLWALSVLKRNPDRYDNAAGVHIRRIMLYFLISTVFVLIEDSFVIFYVDVYTGPGLKIFNRNFSENLQMCGLSLLFVRYSGGSWKCSAGSRRWRRKSRLTPILRPGWIPSGSSVCAMALRTGKWIFSAVCWRRRASRRSAILWSSPLAL